MFDMARRLTDRWQAIFWRGAVTILFAIGAFAWPIMTLSAVLILFGVFALADGALSLVLALREAPRTRWSLALLAEGALGILAGGIALFLPGLALSVALAVVCGWAVLTGVLEIVAASALTGNPQVRIPLAVGGGVSILAGLAIALRPSAGALAILWILGAYALAFGSLLLIIAVRLRAGTSVHDARPSRWPR